MANTNKQFIKFNSDINITSTKSDKLKKSREALKEKITNYFKEHHAEYLPKYYIQGSYKMKNIIQTKDELCDMDLGIHFERIPDVTGTTLQKWVWNAVQGHTHKQEHKKKCIRVDYKDDYHIDLPVYAWDSSQLPILAVKNEDFEKSDPKGFTDWFLDNKTNQSLRLSKYCKAWGDNVRHNMLSGLAFTLLSIEEFISFEERDDKAFLSLLINMRGSLEKSWKVKMPVRPKDNVIEKHDEDFQERFFERLDAIIKNGKQAIETDSKNKASKLWKKHLGARFPIAT